MVCVCACIVFYLHTVTVCVLLLCHTNTRTYSIHSIPNNNKHNNTNTAQGFYDPVLQELLGPQHPGSAVSLTVFDRNETQLFEEYRLQVGYLRVCYVDSCVLCKHLCVCII